MEMGYIETLPDDMPHELAGGDKARVALAAVPALPVLAVLAVVAVLVGPLLAVLDRLFSPRVTD